MSPGLDVRGAYLRTLDLARGLVSAPEVAGAWDAASVLPRFSVRGLTGHLTRAGTLVEQYLEEFGRVMHNTRVSVVPTELARMAEVMSLLGDDASRVQVLFITLDPERDTPELLAEYMNAFDSRFIALRGSDREIAEAARAYRVFYRRIEGSQPGRYTLEHSAYVFALDPQGRLRLRFTGALAPGEIVTDVRHLLDGH